jgi:flagellar hook-length control protein FliK
LPAVAPVPAPLPAIAENAAESIPAVAPLVPAVNATGAVAATVPTAEADRPAAIGQAAETAAPVAPAVPEKAPSPEKPAPAATAIKPDDKAAFPAVARSTADAEPAKPETEISAQKTSAPATEAPAPEATRGNVETPDVKPKMAAGQPAPDAVANTPALPPEVLTHSAAPQHAAEPSAVQRSLADSPVPIAGLAVAITAHAQTGKTRFEIRLDPPELGRIDVRLDLDSNGQVTSHLRVERAETLDLLRRDAPALERALQQAGFKTSDSGLQFSLRDQSFFQQNQGRDTPAMARIVVPDEKLVPVETQRPYGRLAGLGSGVDIRV